LREAERGLTKVDGDVAAAADRLATAESHWTESAAERAALADVQRLTAELEGYRLAQARAGSRLIEAQRALQAARQKAQALSGRRRKNNKRRAAEQKAEAAVAAVHAAKAEREERDRVVETAGPAIDQRISRLAPAVGEMTPTRVSRLATELRVSRERLQQAKDRQTETNELVTRLRGDAARAAAAPRPTAADRELIARAQADGLAELHRRLPRLREGAAPLTRRIDKLTWQHERLVEQLRELGRDAERAIVAEAKVVATTLSTFRLRQPIYSRSYDVVIIDEAAASTLPELVHAVSRATTGAVMLGDFMQNAPIVEGVDGGAPPVARRWLISDCFAFFGVTGAHSRVDGCVALSGQRRFGESINELANLVAYDGLLRTEGRHASRVVFVDVDGLGEELAKIRDNPGGTGRWWVVGALLARAITQYHVSNHGEDGAGVVTPYRVQKEIIEAMLADTGASERIEVSTSHGFQGREFDTIVFDLVEAGQGWVARGSRGGSGYELSGLRLFNVGVTRAKHNLYLIGNGATLRGASAGPLHAITRLIDRGMIEVVPAHTILGAPEPEIKESAAYELWDAVRTYVKVVGIYDEDIVPGELIERLRQARRSIWVWSPWVGRRVEDFLPELRAAAARGVTVRVMVLPTDEVTQPLHPFVDRLRQQLGHVVFVKKEHQKLVVIDEQLTFIGSMNILSHPGGGAGRREVMTLIESADFAKRMLRHERADQFARPPACPACAATMRVAALSGSGRERGWHWWCYNPRPGAATCRERLPFAKDPAGRNQQRPRRSQRPLRRPPS
ncbi:MAG TPA: AAA domain-containing protein, partial [Streptosporangiaceae bacterium]|nr:AAA domain-containing protein [Streptosporangiaceae bacterium]